MIHAEIVLESDGSIGLGCSLDTHMLLCLDSLVQAIAPAATLHDTASLLIDNLHLAVLAHDIIDILVEHRVSLEQLIDSMDALSLGHVVAHQLVFLLELLLLADVLAVDSSNL